MKLKSAFTIVFLLSGYYHVLPGIEEVYHTGNIDFVDLGCKMNLPKNKLLLNIQAQDIFRGTRSHNRAEYKDYIFRNRITMITPRSVWA